jgi:hypothetical protein
VFGAFEAGLWVSVVVPVVGSGVHESALKLHEANDSRAAYRPIDQLVFGAERYQSCLARTLSVRHRARCS